MKPTAALLASGALTIIVSLAIVISQSPRSHGLLLLQVSNVTHYADGPTHASEPQQAPAQDNQGNEAKGRHTITVIDAASRAPVVKASITVKVRRAFNNSKCAGHWEGHTDAKGGFTFICDVPNGSVRTHISIQAAGYWTLDDESFLAEDRVFQLQKAD